MTDPDSSYRTIPLTQGQFALVDAADYDWLMQWKWRAQFNEHTESFYALRFMSDKKGNEQAQGMHRDILGLNPGDDRQGDHRNRNTLDNRRHNLRTANAQQNSCNRKRRKDNSSGFVGVYAAGKMGFRAIAYSRGKNFHLGYFSTAEEAARARDVAAEKLHGEFAHINIPQ